MTWIYNERKEMRGDIETSFEFINRNVHWWWVNRKFERVRRKKYYENFINFGNIKTDDTMVVGEVGAGPFGGIIEVCKLPAKRKVFIDYIMQEQYKLNFIPWPEDALYVDSAAEDIPLDDNCIDLLLSYNCLDHGWNLYDCIKECVRISKKCHLSFDCRGEVVDNDHNQLIKFEDVYSFMCTTFPTNIYNWVVKDMKTKQFPLAYIEVSKC